MSAVRPFVQALTLPILDGCATQANLDIALIDKDIGIVQYHQTIQVTFREMADGLARDIRR